MVAGGQTNLTGENENIRIDSEKIIIDLLENHYSVTVEYEFYNSGQEVIVTTAFPEYKTNEGLQANYKLNNFHISYVDGKEISYEYVEAEDKLSDYFIITGWYTKRIKFSANTETNIKIAYDAEYNQYGSQESAQYLLGTGYTWFGPIKKLAIFVNNHSPFWIDDVTIGNDTNYLYEYVGENKYRIFMNEFEPEIKTEINVIFQKNPLYNRAPFVVSERRFIFKDAGLDKKWFHFLNKSQLRILRNSIYAYRGYDFNSADLKQIFKTEHWYSPNNNFDENNFSVNERQNIKIIQEVEREIE